MSDEAVNTDDVNYKDDIEEKIDESVETQPFKFWEARQRELVTSVVDYNLETLANLITNNIINLSPRYQRRFRWDEKRQSKLIESFLMNVPVPPIFLNEDIYGQYSIIDGKQRLTAIHNFLRGRLVLQGLEIFSDINGKNFDTLPKTLQSILLTRANLRAVIILIPSDKTIKFEVFRRLNTGGVKLNAQEIRNSVFPGNLNNLILDISEDKRFQTLLGIKNKEKSRIYQEMRDAELVLRYFTFKDNWKEFSGGIRINMDLFMENNQKMTDEKIQELRKDFSQTLEVIEAAFGNNAFKRWVPERSQWKQQVLASLYDAQMFACRGLNANEILPKRGDIIQGLKKLFSDPEFRQSVDAATNTPTYFTRRIIIMQNMIYEIIGV